MTNTRLGLVLTLLCSSLCLSPTAFADPLDFLPETVHTQFAIPQTARRERSPKLSLAIDLVAYIRSHVVPGSISDLDSAHPDYNRRVDFGGWIVEDSTASCLDTRATVLVRSNDPSQPIKYKDERGCNVIKGLWHDPYAGSDYKMAKSIQIDHVVPLKHVYLTGAYAWKPAKRCYYANFLHNDFHLLAVSGHENMSKGDRAPNAYLPPDDSYQCQYVSSWMKVKAIWKLSSTADELAAIEDVVQTHHCTDAKLHITDQRLQAERDAIDSSLPERCRDFEKFGAEPSARNQAAQTYPPAVH